MRRTQSPANPAALRTVRALPPQRARLVDFPGLLPALRIGAATVVTALTLLSAAAVVIGVERGLLPRIVIPLISLATLAATAAFLAGKAQGQGEQTSASDRKRAKGRIGKPAAKSAKPAAAAATKVRETDPGTTVTEAAARSVLRTKFLDDISQSLRAPITSICLAARIIRKHFDTTPEVVAHFGDTLLAEADRLGQIVDEFLELARLESGLVVWSDAEVDAADLIQRAVAEVEPIAVSYGVSVAFTMEPGLPSMEVDRDRVSQALTILLALCVRAASEASEIVIQIAGAHGGWVFTVGGTSFVYPHAEARKVHARAEAGVVDASDEAPENAGLGLCLCREIINRYQGRLWIEGAPGPSGCVRFTVPYKQHRRAVASAKAVEQTTAVHGSSSPAAPSQVPGSEADTAEASGIDLEHRRELAVKTLRERAQQCPPQSPEANGAKEDEAVPSTPARTEAPAVASQAAPETAGQAEAAPVQGPPDAAAAEAAVPAAEPKQLGGAAGAGRTEEALVATPAEAPRSKKLFFGRSSAAADATKSSPTLNPLRARERQPESAPAPSAPAAAGNENPVDNDHRRVEDAATPAEPLLVDEQEREETTAIPEIIDDAPVRAPVSGTMISAHHRTAGPPVLLRPGVPAVSGTHSAASAAIQGSDDLLLEIAEAQTGDGGALVVSEEVRSLLATAPGTLPAVAGQQAPAAGSRPGYTPSRRRMVAAPWVVRSQEPADAQPPAQNPTPPASDGAQQRARLSDRLAKRLGISGDGGSGGAGARPGGDARRQFFRTRR